MEFTVETRAGKSFTVDSLLTDREAKAVLMAKTNPSDFECTLAHKPSLSPKMRSWLHVLASWAQNPKRETSSASFPQILAMLTGARNAGKKFPKIKLQTSGASWTKVVLSLSKAGKVNITDGRPFGSNLYFGAIQTDGSFRSATESESVLELLNTLELNPATVATQHGVATGNCCFCARDLSTKESRSVGYGPICASKFGLPWGTIDPDLDTKGKSFVPKWGNNEDAGDLSAMNAADASEFF